MAEMQRSSLEEIVLQTKVKDGSVQDFCFFFFFRKLKRYLFSCWAIGYIRILTVVLETSMKERLMRGNLSFKYKLFPPHEPPWHARSSPTVRIRIRSVGPLLESQIYCEWFHAFVAKLQVQCPDHSCKVKDFLSQALDPPSPFAGKKTISSLMPVISQLLYLRSISLKNCPVGVWTQCVFFVLICSAKRNIRIAGNWSDGLPGEFPRYCLFACHFMKSNRLLTEREGRTGEYWPSVVAVRTSLRSVRTATTEGQYSPVRPEQAQLVSFLLYGTQFLIIKCTSSAINLFNFLSFIFLSF